MAGGLKIVIVEDDASMRRSIGRLLRAAGFECTEYDNAETLLRSEVPYAWDCLVTDIHLPGQSGLELVDGLRQSRPDMPAVLVTAYDEAKTRELALQHHRVAYLAKPFEVTALLDAIHKVTLI
jgi:FixJ family two-component response regulator